MFTASYVDGNNAGENLSLDVLYEKTGVQYQKFDISTFDTDRKIEEFRKEREYGYCDILHVCPEMPNYEEKLIGFKKEHQHPEEEIRLFLEGSAFFDVRDKSDEWIRLKLTPGDLVVLPPGIYHRVTLPEELPNFKVYRLFKNSPIWTGFNRDSTDSN